MSQDSPQKTARPWKWIVIALGFVLLTIVALSALGDREGAHLLIERSIPSLGSP